MDKKFRVIAAALGAHFMAIFGYDEGMFEILLEPNYWVALVFGFLIALFGLYLVFRVTKFLDKKYDWYDDTLIRVVSQVLFAWIMPCMIMFFAAAAYFAFFRTNILETDYLKLDFPVIVILMLVMNLYYLCQYLIWRNKQLKESMVLQLNAVNEQSSRSVLVVNGKSKSMPIRTEDIRQVFLLEGSSFIRTKDMKDYQEAVLTSESLKSIEEKLDPEQFFRVNRQMIIHIDSIDSFSPSKNQTLELFLNPTLFPGKRMEMPPEIKKLKIVSEDRVSSFKRWIER